MDLKKCDSCGCFFASNDTVCPKCTPRELFELSKLKEYLDENSNIDSVDTICVETGINFRNMNRYLSYKDFEGVLKKIDDNDSAGNIGITL